MLQLCPENKTQRNTDKAKINGVAAGKENLRKGLVYPKIRRISSHNNYKSVKIRYNNVSGLIYKDYLLFSISP